MVVGAKGQDEDESTISKIGPAINKQLGKILKNVVADPIYGKPKPGSVDPKETPKPKEEKKQRMTPAEKAAQEERSKPKPKAEKKRGIYTD